MKTCTSCEKTLPLTDFGTKKHTLSDGTEARYHRAKCRTCTRKENIDRYHGNPATKDAHREAAYRYTIKKYGLTVEQFEQMLREQEHCCYVCGTHQSDTRFGKLCIDHDHVTGQVRRLLCSGCNTALGMVKEDVSRLEKLVEYIKEHQLETCL